MDRTRALLAIAVATALATSTSASTSTRAAARSGSERPSCREAASTSLLCDGATPLVGRLLEARGLDGALVMQAAETGAVVVLGARSVKPRADGPIDVTSPLLPLSLSKVFLAASFWDRTASRPADATQPNVHEMLVGGADKAGRDVAVWLRRHVGGAAVLSDFSRYGFPSAPARPRAVDQAFWADGSVPAAQRLVPTAASVTVRADAPDDEWSSDLSVGEHGFTVTLLHLSRFMQAVAADGMMHAPFVRTDHTAPLPPQRAWRVMQAGTARRLQRALLDGVRRGTGREIRNRLTRGWRIGGKTGTGPANRQPYDGCFAGIVVDPAGVPRYTVAAYVRAGGRGGGAAAALAAEVTAFVLGQRDGR